jgi:hypothetical protein
MTPVIYIWAAASTSCNSVIQSIWCPNHQGGTTNLKVINYVEGWEQYKQGQETSWPRKDDSNVGE